MPRKTPSNDSTGDGANRSALTPQEQALRQQRVDVRDAFEDECVKKGADGQGIGMATNRVYGEMFGDRPPGNRDTWSRTDQEDIMIGEIAARRQVEKTEVRQDQSQLGKNIQVSEAAGKGANLAKRFVKRLQSLE